MRAEETIAGLAAFEQRGAGSDAERRAANWLAQRIATDRRTATIEPFWTRPNTFLTHAWHALIGVVGSLVAVSDPRVGGAIVLVALLSLIADDLTGSSIGRRLTFEHASQNVVSMPASAPTDAVHLILTATYDAQRTGLARRLTRARRPLPRAVPGWLGWLAILLAWVLVIAILRLTGQHHGALIGALQLIPTVGLVLALALLIDLGTGGYATGDADTSATGVGLALQIAAALDVAPPPRLSVEIVLQGSGTIGLAKHLRNRKRELNQANTVVIGVTQNQGGTPAWWISDGPFVPQRYLGRLQTLADQIATAEPHLDASGRRGRGATPALPARAARLPAIAIGGDEQTLDASVQFGLLLVDAVAGYIRERARVRSG